MSRTLYRRDQLLQRDSSLQNYTEKKNCKRDPKPKGDPSILLIQLSVGEMDSPHFFKTAVGILEKKTHYFQHKMMQVKTYFSNLQVGERWQNT